jgi:ABC-2 type transport system permease protein
MTGWRGLAIQARADWLVYLRTPVALFFSALLPVIFLLLFTSIFGNDRDDLGIRISTYQVPAFVSLAVVSSAFVGLVISLVVAREQGILKRVRGTPAPMWVVLAGRVAVAGGGAIVTTVVLVVIGSIVFGVELQPKAIPALALAIVLGSATFCALSFAFTRLVKNEGAASALTNFVVLPLYFISGVFVPSSELPESLRTLAGVLPLQPLNDALFKCFNPRGDVAAPAWGDLAVVAAWGLAGALIATRTFLWVPKRDAE